MSTTTLFKHFPSKEALIFDEEIDHEAELKACVENRPTGQAIPDALRDYLLRILRRVKNDPRQAAFHGLIESSDALRDYNDRMWTRHETALAATIAAQSGRPDGDLACAALAHFALQTRQLARVHADPTSAVNAAFDLLENGWRP
ncbi:MAG: hypothetical protein JWQ81_1890 [Amycolatopsis sp.]|nr:hypothetical protein [Amycolatopsis sp.]